MVDRAGEHPAVGEKPPSMSPMQALAWADAWRNGRSISQTNQQVENGKE
jgi:hypothetical protein